MKLAKEAGVGSGFGAGYYRENLETRCRLRQMKALILQLEAGHRELIWAREQFRPQAKPAEKKVNCGQQGSSGASNELRKERLSNGGGTEFEGLVAWLRQGLDALREMQAAGIETVLWAGMDTVEEDVCEIETVIHGVHGREDDSF